MTRSVHEWHEYWKQLTKRGGMWASPFDLKVGDQVKVSGKGYCCGVFREFDDVTGVVESEQMRSGRGLTIRVQDYTQLPVEFWGDPTVTFTSGHLITNAERY